MDLISMNIIEFQPWGCVDEDDGVWYISTYGFVLPSFDRNILEFLRRHGTKSTRRETTIKIEF